jgi:hypothetical protein
MTLNTLVINYIFQLSGEMSITDYHLVAVKVRERLSVNKQTTHKIDMKRLDVVKLNDAETEEHNLYKLLIRFVAEKTFPC